MPALMSPAARQIVSNLTGVLVQAAHPKCIILFGSRARAPNTRSIGCRQDVWP